MEPTKDPDCTTYMGMVIEFTQMTVQHCCKVWSALQTYYTCSHHEIARQRSAEQFVDETTSINLYKAQNGTGTLCREFLVGKWFIYLHLGRPEW